MKALLMSVILIVLNSCSQYNQENQKSQTKISVDNFKENPIYNKLSAYDKSVVDEYNAIFTSNNSDELFKEKLNQLLPKAKKIQDENQRVFILQSIYMHTDLKAAYEYNESLILQDPKKYSDRVAYRCVLKEMLNESKDSIQNCYKNVIVLAQPELKILLNSSPDEYAAKYQSDYYTEMIGYYLLLHKSGDNTAYDKTKAFFDKVSDKMPDDKKHYYQMYLENWENQ